MRYWKIFWALMRRDFTIYFKGITARIIDGIVLFSTSILVFAYIMPLLGLGSSFGLWVFASCFVIFSFFDSVGNATLTVMDLEGDRTILHALSTPLPSNIALMQLALSFAMRQGMMTLIGIPIGKVLLFNDLDLGSINWLYFATAYISVYVMLGFFSLWLASMIRALRNISAIYVRVANPLFMFGAYMFTWQTAYKLAPWFGALLLLNPIVYANEAMRVSVTGQSGFLPFWPAIGAIWIFALLFGLHGVRRLKARLDVP